MDDRARRALADGYVALVGLEDPGRPGPAVAALPAGRALELRVADAMLKAVIEARGEGSTWSEIGAAVGVSNQAAAGRWAAAVEAWLCGVEHECGCVPARRRGRDLSQLVG